MSNRVFRISLKAILVSVSFLAIILFGSVPIAQADNQQSGQEPAAAVSHNGERYLIYHASLDGMSPRQRAESTGLMLRRLAEDPSLDVSRLKLRESPIGTDITYGDKVIATVSIEDAKIEKSSTRVLAAGFLNKLHNTLIVKNEESMAQRVATGIGISLGCTLLLVLSVAMVMRVCSSINERINLQTGKAIKAIRIQKAELFSAEMVSNILTGTVQLIQFFLIGTGLYIYAIIVLSSFPATMGFADMLRDSSLSPVNQAVEHFIAYVPNIIALVVLGALTYATIFFARFIFDAVEARTIFISGFEREWAKPTYKLTKLLIIAFFLVLALPYAPGYESDSFKQVGILFGLLLSLGSTSVVSHVMGGTVLTYTNAFKVGDRVKIGDCAGIVMEKTMFVTRLRSSKNEIISIPNGEILNSHVINYSSMAASGQLILYTTVTIGYDIAWQKVHELLISAALATNKIVGSPEPFVLQKSLTDFSIAYEINAYTDDAICLERTYSQMHQNILDKFNEAGIEIMSPNYFALRDGNDLTIPKQESAGEKDEKAQQDSSGGEAPAFRLRIEQEK